MHVHVLGYIALQRVLSLKMKDQKNKILFLDVDGCLSAGRFMAFDLKKLSELKTQCENNNITVVLSSGRAQPYMEAIAQIIDSSQPFICENGASVYCRESGTSLYEMRPDGLLDYRQDLIEKNFGSIEFEPGKEHSLSFRVRKNGSYLPPNEVVQSLNLTLPPPSSLRVTYSNSAVDIVPAEVDKSLGAEYLANLWNIQLIDCFGFGDSKNDVELLKSVGHSGAPANATSQIKNIATYVSSKKDVAGLIDYLLNGLTDS